MSDASSIAYRQSVAGIENLTRDFWVTVMERYGRDAEFRAALDKEMREWRGVKADDTLTLPGLPEEVVICEPAVWIATTAPRRSA